MSLLNTLLPRWFPPPLSESDEDAVLHAEVEKMLNERWDRAVEIVKYFLDRNSLTCGLCSTLALPILNTHNRYRCPSCAHQFAGAPHNLDGEWDYIAGTFLDECLSGVEQRILLSLAERSSYYRRPNAFRERGLWHRLYQTQYGDPWPLFRDAYKHACEQCFGEKESRKGLEN